MATKLSDYITYVLETFNESKRNVDEIEFDIGLDAAANVDPASQNRIRFTAKTRTVKKSKEDK